MSPVWREGVRSLEKRLRRQEGEGGVSKSPQLSSHTDAQHPENGLYGSGTF